MTKYTLSGRHKQIGEKRMRASEKREEEGSDEREKKGRFQRKKRDKSGIYCETLIERLPTNRRHLKRKTIREKEKIEKWSENKRNSENPTKARFNKKYVNNKK